MSNTLLRVPRQPEAASSLWIRLSTSQVGGYTLTRNAVHYNGITYIGFVDPDGNLKVAAYNEVTRTWTVSPAIATGLGDWHESPSVLVRSSDQKLVVSFAPHDGTHLYVAISTNAEDISAWGTATDIASTVGVSEFTYPMLAQLSGESAKIYLFWRNINAGTATWQFSTSTDGGSTWVAHTNLYSNSGKQGYLSLDTDGVSRIDFIVGDASANLDSVNTGSAYHFYYDGGDYFKSDGTLIGGSGSLPVAPADITKIYDGTTNGGLYYIPCVVTSGATPYVVLVAQDTTGSADPVVFWYGTYSSGWTLNQITDDGVAPNYNGIVGNPILDATDPTIVYLTKYASSVWQTYRYSTSNGGASWSTEQLTSEADTTQANFAIQTVRGGSTVKSIWLYGPITQSYSVLQTCVVRGYPNPIIPL